MFLKLKRYIEEKEATIKDITQKLESAESECSVQKTDLSQLREEMAELKTIKEKITAENEKLNEDARYSQHRLFELQAKVIDSEVEIARLKKEQLGPIVKKR